MWSGMKDDFTPFELAIKLKEKGLNIPFYFFYRSDDKLIHHAMVGKPLIYCDEIDDEVICAPTIPQVLKWLRNTYNLHVETYPCGLGMWKFLVTNITTLEERALCNKYTSWEQATLVGVNYCLENLI